MGLDGTNYNKYSLAQRAYNSYVPVESGTNTFFAQRQYLEGSISVGTVSVGAVELKDDVTGDRARIIAGTDIAGTTKSLAVAISAGTVDSIGTIGQIDTISNIGTLANITSGTVQANGSDIEDSVAGNTGFMQIGLARNSQKGTVAEDDAVRMVTNLNGEQVSAGHTWASLSNRTEEIDPISQHYVSETLIDETNITTDTTSYSYIDMAGVKYVGLQGETSGTAPTDELTVTLEASIQDDSTAAASCAYQDVTDALTGVSSWVDTDFMALVNTPLPVKYLRVKYVTSNGSGNDCDLTVYTKKLY